VIGAGAKGCVVWAASELRDFRDYQRHFDFTLGQLAWLFLVNRGVFLAPGQDEQWTHSVAHGAAEAERFATCFAELAELLQSRGAIAA
jgi:glutamate-1-semialdehyde 2,1-aminomutase